MSVLLQKARYKVIKGQKGDEMSEKATKMSDKAKVENTSVICKERTSEIPMLYNTGNWVGSIDLISNTIQPFQK